MDPGAYAVPPQAPSSLAGGASSSGGDREERLPNAVGGGGGGTSTGPQAPYGPHPGAAATSTVTNIPYHKLYIYYTKHAFLVVGYCRERKHYALLRIARQDGPRLQASEDPSTYTLAELNSLLHSTHAACAHQGGLQFVTKARQLDRARRET